MSTVRGRGEHEAEIRDLHAKIGELMTYSPFSVITHGLVVWVAVLSGPRWQVNRLLEC